jgi:hypothetical protein
MKLANLHDLWLGAKDNLPTLSIVTRLRRLRSDTTTLAVIRDVFWKTFSERGFLSKRIRKCEEKMGGRLG